MTEQQQQPSKPRRPREKYSKLICLACRNRRIRCLLPTDLTIAPGPQPQEADKACQRCRQNNLACVVDSTTLGRPGGKRMRTEESLVGGSRASERRDGERRDDDEELLGIAALEVEDFLLSYPEEGSVGGGVVGNVKPTRSEMSEAFLRPYHLFTALLGRDRGFARELGVVVGGVLDVLGVVGVQGAGVLDRCLVWHRLFDPGIPRLPALRAEIAAMDSGRPQRLAAVFLFALLCDMALDVPHASLAPYRHLHSTIGGIARHHGQQLQFLLPRCDHTVQALVLASEYKPLVFVTSQTVAPHAIKAVTYITSAKQVAFDLGYQDAGTRLREALDDTRTSSPAELETLMLQALQWSRLTLLHDAQASMLSKADKANNTQRSAAQDCLEALHRTSHLGRLPTHLLLAYDNLTCWLQTSNSVGAVVSSWRNLGQLGDIVHAHQAFSATQKARMDSLIIQNFPAAEAMVVLQIAEMRRNILQTYLVGQALFFAIMAGVLDATKHASVQPDQALSIGDSIIAQLMAHQEGDPARTAHRRFMEQFGPSRVNDLEKILTDFITAADTLVLDGVQYVGQTRHTVGNILYTCKELVETNAAKLKGWGFLDERVDTQMILFVECARRLEGMSYEAGSEGAMARGCLFTATAKLVRSLHRILQGFKRALVLRGWQQQSLEGSERERESSGVPSSEAGVVSEGVDVGGAAEGHDGNVEDQFADWDIWPHFNPFDPNDFSDLFGEGFAWDMVEGA
ncbi:hypothetical protein LTR56_003716 [Elasticomyces elasticus]|nr:hypothetical protein LTR22_014646 [Elasticomyces elasticus]KAK3654858.1 hypothetical protein LTR56_003716 [Elasticomyces elasticus]KAK4928813.1 hypothetical protein LTR49_004622 [Elasticomyces elasticus]KAK5766561.1 hypothetical protein LTS12_003180 [Elasticomyces elasticus]